MWRPCLCSSCGGCALEPWAQTPGCRLVSRRLGHGVAGRGGPGELAHSDYNRSSALRRASAGPHKPSGLGPGLQGWTGGGKLRHIPDPIEWGPFLGIWGRVPGDVLFPHLSRLEPFLTLLSWKLADKCLLCFPFFPQVAPPRVEVGIRL